MSVQESTEFLFRLICINPDVNDMFNFGLLYGKEDNDVVIDKLLLRSQCTIAHGFVDCVKGMTLPKMQKKAAHLLQILDFANTVDVVRPGLAACPSKS